MKLCKTCGKEVIKKSCDSKAYFLKKNIVLWNVRVYLLERLKSKTDEQIKKRRQEKV